MATDTAAGSEGTAVPEAPAPEEEVPLPMVAKKEEELSGEGASGEGAVTTAAEEDLEDEEGGMELETMAALPEERELLGEEDGAAESVWRLTEGSAEEEGGMKEEGPYSRMKKQKGLRKGQEQRLRSCRMQQWWVQKRQL